MRKNDIVRCNVCGLTMEITKECDDGTVPVCCGEPMAVLPEQTAEFKFEKHVPYPVSLPDGTTHVVVGKETVHPMLENHHIEWIEIINGDYVNRKYLKAGEAPEADFHVPLKSGVVIREYCNLHGLWVFKVL